MAAAWLAVKTFLGAWWLYGVIIALIFGLGWKFGEDHKQHQWDTANAAAYKDEAAKTATLAESQQLLQRANDLAQIADRAKSASIIASLRNRPERVPAAASATCAGSTGIELARPDAEFLIGQASDNLKWQREVIACYGREDALRKAMLDGRK
jgi:hypothetical protein